MFDKSEEERIGVYVCHCGTNIAGVVDVGSVTRFAADDLKGRGVVLSREYTFMCSTTGQDLIQKDILEQGLTRVVVAACSPHLHEGTFRTACDRAGLNPYLCELASIREHVAWVHTDHAAATAKAKAVVSGAVERVRHNVPLEAIHVPVDATTLVVGGGIAGLQAALEIADAGHEVHLVEREPSIGGHMAQLDKTFPTLDCSACILTPKMTAVKHVRKRFIMLERILLRLRSTRNLRRHHCDALIANRYHKIDRHGGLLADDGILARFMVGYYFLQKCLCWPDFLAATVEALLIKKFQFKLFQAQNRGLAEDLIFFAPAIESLLCYSQFLTSP